MYLLLSVQKKGYETLDGFETIFCKYFCLLNIFHFPKLFFI